MKQSSCLALDIEKIMPSFIHSPSISIITCSLNSEKNILRTIRSVGEQDYKNVQHVFIDGGSTDLTLKLITENSIETSYVSSEHDSGIYDALNKGISKCTNCVVGILHSDDIFHDYNTLSKIASAMRDTDLDYVYGDLVFRKEKNKKVMRTWKSSRFETQMLGDGWMPPHPTVFVRREVFNKIGLYDTKYSICSDYDFVIRLFKNDQIKGRYLECPITIMNPGGASGNSFKKTFAKLWQDYLIIRRNRVGGVSTLLKKRLYKISQFSFNKF